jgi:uncharacterized protein (TIGR03083 family)
MSVLELARKEREDLLETLASLTDDNWQAPTLCESWRVQDVVAHVISYDTVSSRELISRIIRGRFLIDRINAIGVAELTRRSPDELLDVLREHLTPTGLLAAMGGAIGLTDALIHHQDIRRPLGLTRTIPEGRLVAALETALFAPTVAGIRRAWDLRLVATGIDWSFGRGADVHGTAETLLMAIAGRDVTSELSGTGKAKLARRITLHR